MYYVYLAKKAVEHPQPHSRTDKVLVYPVCIMYLVKKEVEPPQPHSRTYVCSYTTVGENIIDSHIVIALLTIATSIVVALLHS